MCFIELVYEGGRGELGVYKKFQKYFWHDSVVHERLKKLIVS